MLESGHSIKIRHGSFYAGAISIFFSESFSFFLLSTPGETERLGIVADCAALFISLDRAFRLTAAFVADGLVEVNCCAALLAAL